MSTCVICDKPLEVEVERDEDEEYEGGASSSGKGPAAAPETYPDDVQLTCGCHFHWYAKLLPRNRILSLTHHVQGLSPLRLRNNLVSPLRQRNLQHRRRPTKGPLQTQQRRRNSREPRYSTASHRRIIPESVPGRQESARLPRVLSRRRLQGCCRAAAER